MTAPAWRAALAACVLVSSLHIAGPAFAQEGGALRPEVGKPLARAKSLLGARRFAEAMAQVRAADAARGKTPQEAFIIAEMRGAIAEAQGDTATAARTYQDLLATGRVPAASQPRLFQAEAGFAYQLGNYPAAIDWLNKYFKAGGNAPEMRNFLITVTYQAKDYATAAKLQQAQIAAGVHAGQKPTEEQLELLARSQENIGDKAGFQNTMVQLVFYYPKPDYWQYLVVAVQTKPGFSSRLSLDLARFEMALGTLTKPADIMDMTELALQVPLPGEAKAIVDQAYTKGILGTGPDARRQQRLRDLVNKTYADGQKTLGKLDADAATDHDGNRLLSLGEIYVSYGDTAKGIPLMEAGIRKGGLRHPEDAKLHLGLAYLKAGQKARSIQVLRTVDGREGAGDIARLWVLFIGHA